MWHGIWGLCLYYDATIDGFSACASGQLFLPNSKWVPGNRTDGGYVRDDPICKGMCVTIQYNTKSSILIHSSQTDLFLQSNVGVD
uniref:Uncharacterized protein n=1 Tax=Ditylenchus dipsaci TaxID=166011 RepID=A0A915DTJ6_9BILA